jgi:acetoin utilization deacetylase AcuC-like enzyme
VLALHHDRFVYPLPEGHRFPLGRYQRLRERLAGEAWLELREARAATDEELALAHEPEYLRRAIVGELSERELASLGLPWSPELVERARRSVGATLEAADAALIDGVAANLGGGTHHAFPTSGRGFCMFNDAVCAVRRLRLKGAAERALIIDVDVHQGDGTHAAFADDAAATTMAVNGGGNYPFRRVPGDVEIDLPNGSGDDVYLSTVAQLLPQSIVRARADICFYVAGADPHEGDRLGRLAVTADGLAERDRMVRDALLAAGIPVVVLLAGGYGRNIDDTVAINTRTIELFATQPSKIPAAPAAGGNSASTVSSTSAPGSS